MLRNGVMIVIALMSGGCLGVVVTCCMVAAKRSDQELGDMMKEREKRRDGDAMRKRNHVIPVRLNARELRELEEQVEKSGLSREEFMRSLILGAQVHAKPCEHHPELLRKIAGLCNNANQLAHVANASGMASEQSVQEMLRLTKETWHLVKEEW